MTCVISKEEEANTLPEKKKKLSDGREKETTLARTPINNCFKFYAAAPPTITKSILDFTTRVTTYDISNDTISLNAYKKPSRKTNLSTRNIYPYLYSVTAHKPIHVYNFPASLTSFSLCACSFQSFISFFINAATSSSLSPPKLSSSSGTSPLRSPFGPTLV